MDLALNNVQWLICHQTKQTQIKVSEFKLQSGYYVHLGGARGAIVIVVGNEHGDTSSNPGRD